MNWQNLNQAEAKDRYKNLYCENCRYQWIQNIIELGQNNYEYKRIFRCVPCFEHDATNAQTNDGATRGHYFCPPGYIPPYLKTYK
jgi:hypothetical protein